MDFKNLMIILLLLPLFGYSQIKGSIDIVGGIGYSDRILKSSNKDELTQEILTYRDSVETGKLNWTFGLNYSRRIINRLFFKTGFRVGTVGYKGEKKTGLVWPSEINEFGDINLNPELPHEVQIIYDYWVAKVPLSFRFELWDKGLTPFIEVGVSPSIGLTSRITTITDLGATSEFNKIDDAHQYLNLQVIGIASIGMNLRLSEYFQFFTQPVLRYHFTKSVDTPIEEVFYDLGIEIGIRKLLIKS